MKQKRFFMQMILVFLIILTCRCIAQNKIITSYEYSQHNIIIYYQFEGDPSIDYNISILLKRSLNRNFNLKPESIAGDIGEGKFANEKRKVIWHLTQQEEGSLTGDDYYFEITANEIKKGGGIAWYVYVGGIILGGGTAAVLLLNKKNETTTSSSSFTFPNPPGRPNN